MLIVPIAHSSHQVQFTCAAGSALADWKGAGTPELGLPVDVELDVVSTYRWDEVRTLENAQAGLEIGPTGSVLTARFVRVEEDGVVLLALPAIEVIAEIRGEAPVPGGLVRFQSKLAVWPTGI
jgi:hypothetical protein